MSKTKYVRNENNLAVVYARYSSHSQNEASIEQQLEAARQYALLNNLEIIEEYCDAAMSGKRDDRPEFQRMLSEVDKLKPSTLILWKGDRLARDKVTAIVAKHQLKSNGCFPVYVTENIDTEDINGVLLEGILEVISDFYAEQTKANVKRGMSYNANNCLSNGSKKYGYDVDSTKHYVINPLEAEVVREIFTSYDSGKRPKDIAEQLNSKGIRTLCGKLWRNDSVMKIIKNETYKGVYSWGDSRVEGGMPAIVDDSLWERCNERRKLNMHHKRKVGEGADYWLVPKLYCGKCGGLMSGAFGKSGGNNKQYFYYHCTNKNCDVKYVNKEKLEETTKQLLSVILSNRNNIVSLAADAYVEYMQSRNNDNVIEELKSKLSEAKSKHSNYIRAIEQGLITPAIKENLENVENEIIGLQSLLDAEIAKSQLCESEETIADYINKYVSLNLDNLEELKELFEYFVIEMRLVDNCLVASCRYSEGNYTVEVYDYDDFVAYPDAIVEGDNFFV